MTAGRHPSTDRRDADDRSERRIFGVLGVATLVVVVATAAAVGYVVYDRVTDPAPPAAPATPTPPATPAAPGEPALVDQVRLTDAPGEQASTIMNLEAGTPIRVLGRSADGDWLIIGPVDQREVIGWVPFTAVTGVGDGSTLTVVTVDGVDDSNAASAAPTLTPDLPDLRLLRAFSRNNQLHVEVGNEGAADFDARILVSVNDADPVPLELRPGEVLRPDQRLEAPIPGEYLQLRATILVSVSSDPALDVQSSEGRTWAGIVEPDELNDLEISGAAFDGPGESLTVTVRNNSPIPIRGNITLTVREALPSTTLLGRQVLYVEIDRADTIDVGFPEIAGIVMDDLAIRLSTNAIQDGMIDNNVYPR